MTKLLLTFFFSLLGLGSWSACTDAPSPNTPDGGEQPRLARLELTAPTTMLDPGASMSLMVAAFDADGAPVPTPPITWASSDSSIVAITSTGDVTARAAGTARILASSGSITGSLDLVVREAIAVVDHVEIGVDQLVLAPGTSAQLEGIAYDADDNALPGRTITWTSSDDTVAVISTMGATTGELTAVAPGTATISAHCEGTNAQVQVRVHIPVARLSIDVGPALDLRPAQTRQLVVTAYAANDAVLADREVTWSVDVASVATVTDTGLVTAHGAGTAIVTATVEGIPAQLALTVRTVDRIQLNRNEATIDLAEQLQVTAQLFDAANQPIQDAVTWSSDHPEIASVDTNGLVVGQTEGGAIITATSGTTTATVLVHVATWTERNLVTINGAPAPATLYEYTTQLGGIDRQLRMRADDGVLATRALDGRYELMVFGPVFFDDVESGYATHTSAGSMQWDDQAQLFHFLPDSFFGGSPFTGRYVGTTMELTYQPAPRGAPATVVFAGT